MMAKSSPQDPLLANLTFENKKNKSQPRLPLGTAIQRRPLNHAPVASPYAGASVQKVVYVSSKTPLMSAVKRVKNLLAHIEKRAMQDVDISKGKDAMKRLAEASGALGKNGEEVVVKASGRAIGQAMKVGEWFMSKVDEISCRVEVRTGSVQAVDDLIEVEAEDGVDDEEVAEAEKNAKVRDVAGHQEDTLQNEELDHGPSTGEAVTISSTPQESTLEKDATTEPSVGKDEGQNNKKRRKRGKRKKRMYDKDDMPEARIRWVNTVEIAISLKG